MSDEGECDAGGAVADADGADVAPCAPETAMFYCHPGELSLKGKNRGRFEEMLVQNIRRLFRDAGIEVRSVRYHIGRALIVISARDVAKAQDVLPRVFGISVYGRCYSFPRSADVDGVIVEHFRAILPVASFKIESTRVDKRYPRNSQQMNREIGAKVVAELGLRVDLTHPEVELRVEVLNNQFLVYSQRSAGAGGLPVGSSGSVVSMISGGFDSPVAALLAMKRGCDVVFLHCHSAPFGDWRGAISKIRKIVARLTIYGGPSTFYAVAIGEQQRLIAAHGPEKLRVTLYRRLMARIGREIARRHKCECLVTGDNLGQVASQTIASMTTIQAAIAPFLILRPLLTFDKAEIIKIAEKIGTAPLSMLPGGDCCSEMLPKQVATQPSIEDAAAGESQLDVEKMARDALAGAQVISIHDPWAGDEAEAVVSCPFVVQQ